MGSTLYEFEISQLSQFLAGPRDRFFRVTFKLGCYVYCTISTCSVSRVYQWLDSQYIYHPVFRSMHVCPITEWLSAPSFLYFKYHIKCPTFCGWIFTDASPFFFYLVGYLWGKGELFSQLATCSNYPTLQDHVAMPNGIWYVGKA